MLWDALRRRLETDAKPKAVGMMVGTSLDGIDLCLVELDGASDVRAPRFLHGETRAFEISEAAFLRELAEGKAAPASVFAGCAFTLREDHERALRAFLASHGISPHELAYVAAHGVTISHRPNSAGPHSWQLLDAEGLAARLGCPVFSDFRAAEVALGGQGAPLAPIVDGLLRASGERDRAILNLGGIANITLIPAGGGECVAGDIGPANMPLDLLWRRGGEDGGHDPGGARARSGSVDADLLASLLRQEWVERALPRSFGREEFGEPWVEALEAESPARSLADRLATVVALEVEATRVFLERIAPADWRAAPGHELELFVTGGGVHNAALMDALGALDGVSVDNIAALGEDPDFKEAYDFAVLGWLRLCHRASRGCVLGAIHFPDVVAE